jgi:hypothetical protein
MQQLAKNNALPAMFFHSDKSKLNQYHREITDMLLDLSQSSSNSKVKIPKYKEKDLLPGDVVGYYEWKSPFGFLGDNELAEIFKHKSDHSGAEGSKKFRFGIRGQKVKKSTEFAGIKLGLGIHHHDIDAAVRDAVEAGLRMNYLKVVLCDYTMALGLNMPIKTVVFVGSQNETISPDDFIQASGRAGRWGQDTQGSVLFIGHSWSQVKRIWNPISQPVTFPFPISNSTLLAICAGSRRIRQQIRLWFNYSVPQWGWTPETCQSELATRCRLLQQWGLVTSEFEVTQAGVIALSLIDEEDISLAVGYIFSKYANDLRKAIKSKRDFLFVCSHFLREWRQRLDNAPTLADPLLNLSPEVRQTIARIQADLAATPHKLTSTEKITLLYVVYPDLTQFTKHGHSKSLCNSLMAHFVKKMELFQSKADLPGKRSFSAIGSHVTLTLSQLHVNIVNSS